MVAALGTAALKVEAPVVLAALQLLLKRLTAVNEVVWPVASVRGASAFAEEVVAAATVVVVLPELLLLLLLQVLLPLLLPLLVVRVPPSLLELQTAGNELLWPVASMIGESRNEWAGSGAVVPNDVDNGVDPAPGELAGGASSTGVGRLRSRYVLRMGGRRRGDGSRWNDAPR
jgi:hypothetical protein